jgi:ABC-type spermidine/putrescine transport system permease subunit II
VRAPVRLATSVKQITPPKKFPFRTSSFWRRLRNHPTPPVHIFSQIQWQGDPTIAAASSMQIVIIGLLILVVQRIFRLRLVV